MNGWWVAAVLGLELKQIDKWNVLTNLSSQLLNVTGPLNEHWLASH